MQQDIAKIKWLLVSTVHVYVHSSLFLNNTWPPLQENTRSFSVLSCNVSLLLTGSFNRPGTEDVNLQLHGYGNLKSRMIVHVEYPSIKFTL